jgi:hypothetical protein
VPGRRRARQPRSRRAEGVNEAIWPPRERVQPDDSAIILYTSGTTASRRAASTPRGWRPSVQLRRGRSTSRGRPFLDAAASLPRGLVTLATIAARSRSSSRPPPSRTALESSSGSAARSPFRRSRRSGSPCRTSLFADADLALGS